QAGIRGGRRGTRIHGEGGFRSPSDDRAVEKNGRSQGVQPGRVHVDPPFGRPPAGRPREVPDARADRVQRSPRGRQDSELQPVGYCAGSAGVVSSFTAPSGEPSAGSPASSSSAGSTSSSPSPTGGGGAVTSASSSTS